MLFKQIHLQGILEGNVSLAFRVWEKPSVKKESLIKTPIGVIRILNVEAIEKEQITSIQAKKAGYSSKEDLLKTLKPFRKDSDGIIYKIEVQYHSEDPRIQLREDNLTNEKFSEIIARLDRLDSANKQGPWTRKILSVIAKYPYKKAAELSQRTGLEKEWLKLNIRKLKNLGLTISHTVGYELSPLGKQFFHRWNQK